MYKKLILASLEGGLDPPVPTGNSHSEEIKIKVFWLK